MVNHYSDQRRPQEWIVEQVAEIDGVAVGLDR
jgi:hypothetical protein